MRHFGEALVAARPQFVTESYVSIPPAAWIVDEAANVFELGTRRYDDPHVPFHAKLHTDPRGEFAFNVLINGQETGEYASRIERRNGRVRIFIRGGWKVWNGRSFF